MSAEDPEPSQAATALVLGILSLFVPILGPFAWGIGGGEVKAIDEGRRPPENRSLAQAGKILGMIMTWLMIVGFGLLILLIVLAVANASS